MRTLCMATNNAHKIAEIRKLIDSSINLLSLKEIGCFEELPETSDTVEGNSLQKAQYVFIKYSVPCFADDTGLEVEALDGEPGVYSAMYAGEDRDKEKNIDLLLKNMAGFPNRAARFRTVITLIGVESNPVFFEGVIEGTITNARRGGNGFGYDSVFEPEGSVNTFAEMSLDDKNKLSHRARAVSKLVEYLGSSNRQRIPT